MLHKILKPFSITIVSLLIMGFGFYVVKNSLAQISIQEISNAQLLKEYFLPINALVPKEEGKIKVGGAECDQIGIPGTTITTTAGVYGGNEYRSILPLGEAAYVNCSSVNIDKDLGYSPVLKASTTSTRKTVNGLEFQDGNGTAVYKINIAKPSVYHLSLGAYNTADSFDSLTRNQYEDIKADVYVEGSDFDYPYSSFMPSSALPETHTELAARRLMFQIAVDSPENIVGVIDVLDGVEKKYGNLMLGLLEPGQHTIFVTFANDLEIDLGFDTSKVGSKCTPTESCSAGLSCLNQNSESIGVCGLSQTNLGNFLSADINKNGKLEKTPVITDLLIAETQSTNDVIGVRVFNNPAHLSALDWYSQNLVNQGNPVPVIVDGYNGVLDQRTAYINAANINEGGIFYTNIYVIAHNINASPQTIEVFNRIVSNWKFNKNIIESDGEVAGELVKNKLRRDVTRLEHLNFVRKILEDYKATNGFYPKLDAGTFVTGKVMSTWGTWQSVFSSALGAVMPLDPLNMMSDEFYPGGSANSAVPRQYDCTNQFESTQCKNICTRDSEDKPLTGCPLEEQCVGSSYCSIVPAGHDALTGWSEENQSHYFASKANGVYPEGTFNTGGADLNSSDRFNDDAFIYQYATKDNGDTYAFTYRLEYRNFCTERYANGACKSFSNTLCGPGSCYLEGSSQCIDSGKSPYDVILRNTTGTDAEKKAAAAPFSNLYCFGGQLVNSCGNGIYQPEAGETCEFTQDFSDGLYCDQKFTQQNWYNEKNIGDKCTSSCRLASDVTAGQLPVAYNSQAPGQSCGGFCGDGTTQYEFYEQCDVTTLTPDGVALVPKIAVGGSGGVSADSQYACTVATGATIKSVNLITDPSFESISSFGSNLFSEVPTDGNGKVTINDNWSYDGQSYNIYTDTKTGVKYPGIEINTRQARTGTKSLFLQKKEDVATPTNRYVFVSREINNSQKYTFEAWVKQEAAMESQTSDQEVKVVVQFFDAGKNLLNFGTPGYSATCSAVGTAGDCLISSTAIIDCAAGDSSCTKLETDRWIKLSDSFTPPSSAKYVNVGIMIPDAVNSNKYAIYVDDVRLAAQAGCQTYGGYCGDSITQAAYSEQCDIASHVPPSPKRSVDQINNGSFESGDDSWLFVGPTGVSDIKKFNFASIFTSTSGTELYVNGGFKSYKISPKVSGAGVGQKAVYQPLKASPTTIKVRIDARTESGDSPLVLEARAFQYDFTGSKSTDFLKEDNSYVPYLSSKMYVVDKKVDPVTKEIKETLTTSFGVNSFYKTYEATLTLPPATPTNSNAVTLVSVAFVNPSIVDGTLLPTTENYYLDEFSVDSNYRLNYLCGKVSNKLCQFSGGYCGDGKTQTEFGESCDLGVKGKICDDGLQSCPDDEVFNGSEGAICSKFCSFPSCGDGIKGKIYNPVTKTTITEKCDYSDPKDINRNNCLGCTRLTQGAYCSSDSDCDGTDCIDNICATGVGKAGCKAGSCPDGWVCEESTTFCRPKLDVYLKQRFSEEGFKVGTKTFFCPFLDPIGLVDQCTGVRFIDREDTSSGLKSFFSTSSMCPGNTRSLPSIKQLFTLAVGESALPVRPYDDNDGTTYTDNSVVKLCTVKGANSSSGGADNCRENGDPRYLYWSSTPYPSGQVICENDSVNEPFVICSKTDLDCQKYTTATPKYAAGTSRKCEERYYYAVDFKKKTIDVIESSSNINAKCIASTSCGNGTLDGDEQCEFNGVNEFFSNPDTQSYCASNPDAQLRAPYDAGRVHCDVNTCKYRFDNCVIATKVEDTKDSCTEICSTINKVEPPNPNTVKSFGTNLTETYPNLSPTVNNDVNRRPKSVDSIYANGVFDKPQALPSVITSDNPLLIESAHIDYKTILDDKFFYPSTDPGDSDMYSTADDGLIVKWIDSSCKFFLPAAGKSYEAGGGTGSCPLGFMAKSLVDWEDFNPYEDTEKGTSLFTNFTPEATLCRCVVPPLPQTLPTGSDNAQVQAINDAALLVAKAEETRDIADFEVAQDKVTALFNLLTTYKTEAQDLQIRLNILAESIVIELETGVASQKDEVYSLWKFDEGINRISYNTGTGRTDLDLGYGLNMTMNCIGVGCVKTINWPIHKVCSDNLSKSCTTDSECTGEATCKNGFETGVTLDGDDDYMTTPSDYFSTTKGTVAMWVNFNSLNYSSEGVSYLNPAFGLFSYYKDTDESISLRLVDKNKLQLRSNDTICVESSVITITPREWNHIAFTYDFGTDSYIIYFNGIEVGNDNGCTTAPGLASGQNIVFGADRKDETLSGPIPGYDFTDFSPVTFDDIYMYDDVKTGVQINALKVAPPDTGPMAFIKGNIKSIARTIYNLVTWLR